MRKHLLSESFCYLEESIQIPAFLLDPVAASWQGWWILYLPSNCSSLQLVLCRKRPGTMAFRHWSIAKMYVHPAPTLRKYVRPCHGPSGSRVLPGPSRLSCALMPLEFCYLSPAAAFPARSLACHSFSLKLQKLSSVWRKTPGKDTWFLLTFLILSG